MIKLNEKAWFYIKGAASNYGYGTVFDKIVINDKTCYFFWCEINGGQRFGLETNYITKPDARMLGKLHSVKFELSKIKK
jgi:hypothetical protein